MTHPKRSNVVDQGIETTLECHIETTSEYQIGQPITIEGTLHNSGSSDIWILYRNTFLDPNWQDCVSLTREGSPVPYTGLMVSHGTPHQASFIRIPAGGSESRRIDLSQKYELTEPGEYQASFYLPILGAVDEGTVQPPTDEEALQLTLVESAKVSFRISGMISTMASTSLQQKEIVSSAATPTSFPLQPKEPNYTGVNQQQQDALHRAHFTAYNNILLALDAVQRSIAASDNRLYSEWFDVQWIWGRTGPWEQRRQTVIDTLSKMARLMSTEPPITYGHMDKDSNCSFDRIAYTYLNSRKVFACDNFFNDDFLRFAMWNSAEWARAFAVVHEISHAAGGTTDDWYNWSICQQLSTFNPNLAVINAQNYALYVMMRAGGDLPMTSKYQVRCYDKQSNAFLGWLDSSNNWLSLTGNDPQKPTGSTLYWYEYGGEKFLMRTGSSRYIGDNGNKGTGNTEAAWNLWSRATAVYWTEPSGQICISANNSQRLVKGGNGWLYWSDDAKGAIAFEFIEV